MEDRDLVGFLQWALPKMGLRWAGFRKPRGQVKKRLARRLDALGLASLDAYRRRLMDDDSEWAALKHLCRVTITRFWRDKRTFERLIDVVLPERARIARDAGRSAVRAWSAGCASGEEPYSLMIGWRERAAPTVRGVALEVVATDIDVACLERAAAGVYPEGVLRDLPEDLRRAAFDRLEGGEQRLRDAYREGVRFARQRLEEDTPDGLFDVVLCRNLAFTYFAEDAQRGVLERIEAHLRPGGWLALGNHEALPDQHTSFVAGELDPNLYAHRPD